MPINPFRRFSGRRPPRQVEREQADRAARQAERSYTDRGFSKAFAEQQAGEEFQLAQAVKNKRGLKGVRIGGAFNQ